MENPAKSATAEKDPVCGMTVDSANAKSRFEHNAKTYYFCCASCLEKFRADPVAYLSKPAREADGRTNHKHRGGYCKSRASKTCCLAAPTLERFHLPDVSRGSGGEAGRVPSLWNGARARDARCRDAGGIHLPHASRNRSPGTGKLPHLRDGA
jgi:YHS domain-containing protein